MLGSVKFSITRDLVSLPLSAEGWSAAYDYDTSWCIFLFVPWIALQRMIVTLPWHTYQLFI